MFSWLMLLDRMKLAHKNEYATQWVLIYLEYTFLLKFKRLLKVNICHFQENIFVCLCVCASVCVCEIAKCFSVFMVLKISDII